MNLRTKIIGGVIGVFALITGLGFIGKNSTPATIPSPAPVAAEVKAESTTAPEASYPAESIVTPENMNSPKVTATPKASVQASVKPQVKASVAPSVAPKQEAQAGGSCQYSCSSPDRDCSDFSSHAQAQAFFNCCGFTAENDPMKLDSVGVGDGVACENI